MNNIDVFLYYCLKTVRKRWLVNTIPFLLFPVLFCEKGDFLKRTEIVRV